MAKETMKKVVGEVRRSQVLHASGVGGVIDLPSMSAMVLGLHRWEGPSARTIVVEDRLLAMVRRQLGSQVEKLCLPPVPKNTERRDVYDPEQQRGVPVVPFPGWLRCPRCELLAPRESGSFKLNHNPYKPERTRYEHVSCPKTQRPPPVTPARFVIACENGHIDDFPWREYLGCTCGESPGALRFQEIGVSAEVADLWVKCEGCDKKKPMVHAFGEKAELPACSGRHPHLGRDVQDECTQKPRTMLVGASNLWFPITATTLSLPTQQGRLEALVEKKWDLLDKITSLEVMKAFRSVGNLDAFRSWNDDELWAAIAAKRGRKEGEPEAYRDPKLAEWALFSNPDSAGGDDDFRLRKVEVPAAFRREIAQVVLVEKLRVVKALTGFTRIRSPGDFADPSEIPADSRVRLSRAAPTWVPAAEVRGEGIFLRFREEALEEYAKRKELRAYDQMFRRAHGAFRKARRIEPADGNYPFLRYILLHSLAHLLIRQLAIECGYAAASVGERIYSRGPEEPDGPMAGILLYTAAADSEGTLGGLVALGQPLELGRHLKEALRRATLCSSDPLCSEHAADKDARTIHGGACHACMFVSETSCERGNKYVDRNLLVRTMAEAVPPFFAAERYES